jgi:hypothetical protein
MIPEKPDSRGHRLDEFCSLSEAGRIAADGLSDRKTGLYDGRRFIIEVYDFDDLEVMIKQ